MIKKPIFIYTVGLGAAAAMGAGILSGAAGVSDERSPRVQAMSQALRDPEALSTLGLCAAELQAEARLAKTTYGVQE